MNHLRVCVLQIVEAIILLSLLSVKCASNNLNNQANTSASLKALLLYIDDQTVDPDNIVLSRSDIDPDVPIGHNKSDGYDSWEALQILFSSIDVEKVTRSLDIGTLAIELEQIFFNPSPRNYTPMRNQHFILMDSAIDARIHIFSIAKKLASQTLRPKPDSSPQIPSADEKRIRNLLKKLLARLLVTRPALTKEALRAALVLLRRYKHNTQSEFFEKAYLGSEIKGSFPLLASKSYLISHKLGQTVKNAFEVAVLALVAFCFWDRIWNMLPDNYA